jgi:hypothetical protein
LKPQHRLFVGMVGDNVEASLVGWAAALQGIVGGNSSATATSVKWLVVGHGLMLIMFCLAEPFDCCCCQAHACLLTAAMALRCLSAAVLHQAVQGTCIVLHACSTRTAMYGLAPD